MPTPAADPNAAPYSAAGVAGMSNNHSYDTSTPWRGDGYADSPIGAYAPPPSVDPDRLDQRTRVQTYPSAHDVDGYYRRADADTAQRESVTAEVSTGWTERKSGSGYSEMAPRPLGKDTGEPRPTLAMSPNTYAFERPFDAKMERRFTGEHFSMADHRRTFEIYGMAPVARARNTYRIEPGPTDRDITDMPPDNAAKPQYAPAPDIPVSSVERNWRI